jgi:hypothetical protein
MTKIEYIGGCKALPSGERLRCGSALIVSVESTDVDELSRSLLERFSGKLRLMLESDIVADSCKKDEADDLSERRLDFPVKAALVREWSELPEESEREGESRERSEADKLGAGDLTDSLRSGRVLWIYQSRQR